MMDVIVQLMPLLLLAAGELEPLIQRVKVVYDESGLDHAERNFDAYTEKTKRDVEDVGDHVDRQTNQAGGAFTRMGRTMKAALGMVVAYIGTEVLQAFGRLTGKIYSVISSAEETQSKFETTFGAAASSVQAFIDEYATLAGLTEQAAQEITATLGAMSQGFGLSKSAAGEFSEEVVRLAGDLASFNNVPIDQALQAIQSGLIGEQEPLRRFGILLSAATVEQEALANRAPGVTGELSEQEKVLARLSLAYEQAGVQVGDLERTQESMQNRVRRLRAEIGNHATEMAKDLMPAYEDALWYLDKLFEHNKKVARSFGETVTGSINRNVESLIDIVDYIRQLNSSLLRLQRNLSVLAEDERPKTFFEEVEVFFRDLAWLVDEAELKLAQFWKFFGEGALRTQDMLHSIGLARESGSELERENRFVQIMQKRIDKIRESRQEEAKLREERERARKQREQARQMRKRFASLRRAGVDDRFVKAGAPQASGQRGGGKTTGGKKTGPTDAEIKAWEDANAVVQQYLRTTKVAAEDTERARQALQDLLDAKDDVARLEQKHATVGTADSQRALEAARVRRSEAEQELQSARGFMAEQRRLMQMVNDMGEIEGAALSGAGASAGTGFDAFQTIMTEGRLNAALTDFNEKMADLRVRLRIGPLTREQFEVQAASAAEALIEKAKETYRRLHDLEQIPKPIADALEAMFDAGTDGAEKTDKEVRKLSKRLDDLARSSRAILQLADAFGEVDENVRGMADGAIAAIDNLAALQDMKESQNEGEGGSWGSLLGSASGMLKAIPAIGGALAGAVQAGLKAWNMFSGPTGEELDKMRSELAENASALKENTQALFESAQIGSDVDKAAMEEARRLMREIAGGGDELGGEISGLFQQLEGTGIGGLEGISDTFSSLTELLNAEVGEKGFSAFRQDEARAVARNLLLYGEARGENAHVSEQAQRIFEEQFGENFTPLMDMLDELGEKLGMFGDSVAGAQEKLDFMQSMGLAEGNQAFQEFAQHLLDMSGELPDKVESLLEKGMELDLSTAEGKQQLKKLYQQVAAIMAEGSLPEGFLGDLTTEEVRQILDTISGFAEGTAGAGGPETTTTSVVDPGITEFQSNTLLTYEREGLFLDRTRNDLLRALAVAMGAQNLPSRTDAMFAESEAVPILRQQLETQRAILSRVQGGQNPDGSDDRRRRRRDGTRPGDRPSHAGGNVDPEDVTAIRNKGGRELVIENHYHGVTDARERAQEQEAWIRRNRPMK